MIHKIRVLEMKIKLHSLVDKSQRSCRDVYLILIKKHLKRFIKVFHYVLERIITIEKKMFEHSVIKIGAHAPYVSSNNAIKNKFYEELSYVALGRVTQSYWWDR